MTWHEFKVFMKLVPKVWEFAGTYTGGGGGTSL